jgi:phosphatidylinositol alpha-1,6-mannosyltransferase
MRVLFITWNYPPKMGGMEMMLSQLVRYLRCHADVHVFAPYAKQTDSGVERGEVTRPKRDGLAFFAFFSLFSCVRLLRRDHYDLIVGGSALVMPLLHLLGWLYKLPVAVHVHGLDLVYSHPVYQWMVGSLLPKCDCVFANSHASKEEALKRGGMPDQVLILQPGLDFSEFQVASDVDDVRRRYSIDRCSVLLSVGRLTRRKGLVEFVRFSLPAIVDNRPDTVLLIVGDNPTLSLTHKEDIRTCIQAEAIKLGLENHVRMLGWINRQDLIELYHTCDVFVLPAIKVPGDVEGFGIVLIEASAAGKPVVSTKLGGITDAVEDGKSGILVESGMWDRVTDATLRLLADKSLRREMGNFGRRRVETQFDWPIVARRYAEHLAALISDQEVPA